MIFLARSSIRRPKAALAAWLAVAIALSVVGFGVASTLSPSVTVVPGTESSRAQQLASAQFGPTQLVPILLEGPTQQLDRQGPKLVAALAKRPQTRVLSEWDAGTASAGLRPKPTAAMIVVSVDRSEKTWCATTNLRSSVSYRGRYRRRPMRTSRPTVDRSRAPGCGDLESPPH